MEVDGLSTLVLVLLWTKTRFHARPRPRLAGTSRPRPRSCPCLDKTSYILLKNDLVILVIQTGLTFWMRLLLMFFLCFLFIKFPFTLLTIYSFCFVSSLSMFLEVTFWWRFVVALLACKFVSTPYMCHESCFLCWFIVALSTCKFVGTLCTSFEKCFCCWFVVTFLTCKIVRTPTCILRGVLDGDL